MLNRPDDAVSRMAQAASSAPHPRFTKYQIEMLKRVMATIQGAPAGSAERHERRVAAVQMCYDIVSRGGCTSTTPYELALRLLEVEEEVSACAAGTGAGVSFSLPAGASKGIVGMGGASAAGGSVSRSISIQRTLPTCTLEPTFGNAEFGQLRVYVVYISALYHKYLENMLCQEQIEHKNQMHCGVCMLGNARYGNTH